MYPVVRPSKSVLALSLRVVVALFVANLLVLSTGCSWFKKPAQATTPPTLAATPAPTQEPPKSIAPEGPRPGELLPFPELKVIYFDFDRSNIRANQRENIESNLQYLKDHPADKVLITGFCDERGTTEYNLALGQRRAEVVRGYYVKNNIDPNRVATLSKGEENPVDPGHNEAAWKQNRRAEFQRMF
jgi:peptidoglycan-associated lipoprotein